MTYRILGREEWPKVEHVFLENGVGLPHNGMIVVAEEDNKIVGFQVLQAILHVEPLWIDEEYRGKVNVTRLTEKLKDQLASGTEFYAFAPDRRICWLAGSAGLKKLTWEVWKGVA